MDAQLSQEEKNKIVNQVINDKVTLDILYPGDKKYIDSVGDYLAENFKKIDGFDYRWNSLITSRPLLFEDIDYLRVYDCVKNEITPEEIAAYKAGKLRDLYSTLENMLVCNLEYYDRIMCIITMMFHHYVRISENQVTNEHIKKLPHFFDITPTKIWCMAMTSQSSTEWELNYAWKYSKKNIIKIHCAQEQLLKQNYQYLYKNPLFARFVEYRAMLNGTQGFMMTLLADKTPNHKLAQICSKFTKTSTAIDDAQLDTLINYVIEDKRSTDNLYNALKRSLKKIFPTDEDYAIFCFATEFFIFTKKFKMKILKDENGKISKQYLSNNYECFIAESHLSDTIKYQIEWARYQMSSDYQYDKDVLIGLLTTMLQEDFKNIKCIKKMDDFKTYAEVTFTGCFDNVYANEKFYMNDVVVHESRKCYGKENMAKYLVNRGYYIFGTIHDVDILFIKDITKNTLISHYGNYCIPVMQHMNDVILTHLKSKNDIIDVVTTGELNPDKLSTEIQYTLLRGNSVNNREIMNSMRQISENIKDTKKGMSYWRAINS